MMEQRSIRLTSIQLRRRYLFAYFLQMTDFVGGHNDAAEAAGILNDGHTVDLFQSLVDHTGAAHVRKSCTSWG